MGEGGRLPVVVWWRRQKNSDEVTLTGCEHQQGISGWGIYPGKQTHPPSGEFAWHDDLTDTLFAAELAQQLLRSLQSGAAVAEIDRERFGEQEVKQRGVTDAAHLQRRNMLLLQVFDGAEGDGIGGAHQRGGLWFDG